MNLFGSHTTGFLLLLFLVLLALTILAGGLLIRSLRGQEPQISMTDIKLSSHEFNLVLPMGTTGHEKLTISNESESAFSWRMAWDATWLNVQPATGTITPSISETIQIDFDAMSLVPNSYTTMLILTDNENSGEEIEIPIRLQVTFHENYLPLIKKEPEGD